MTLFCFSSFYLLVLETTIIWFNLDVIFGLFRFSFPLFFNSIKTTCLTSQMFFSKENLQQPLKLESVESFSDENRWQTDLFFVPQPNFFSRSAQSGNGRRVSVERRPKRGRNRNRKSLGSLFRWSWKFGTETGWETTRPVSNALITNNWISMLESAHSKSVQTSRTIWTQSDIKRALNSSTYPRSEIVSAI